jgi:hypothetical protein
MKADGDSPGCAFEANSFDNPLNRGDALHGIELLPFDGSQLLSERSIVAHVTAAQALKPSWVSLLALCPRD